MAFNPKQFRSLIERVLLSMGVSSPNAVDLLLGTCAQESEFGTHLRQIKGPALGCMQIERPTFLDLQFRYRKRFPDIAQLAFEELEWNLWGSILVARCKYLDIPKVIPDTLQGRAEYWDNFYNCNPMHGTPEEYIENYQRYVLL